MRRGNLDGQLSLQGAFDNAAREEYLKKIGEETDSQDSASAKLTAAERATKYCRPIIDRIDEAIELEKKIREGHNPELFDKHGHDVSDSPAWEYYRDRSKK